MRAKIEFTPEQEDAIIGYYIRDELAALKIAEKFKVSFPIILRVLKAAGVDIDQKRGKDYRKGKRYAN